MVAKSEKGKLLLAIFNEFDRAGLRYVLLPPYDGLPDNPVSDVDFCVPAGRVRAATGLIRRMAGDSGWEPVQTFFQPGGAVCLVIWHRATDNCLMLDACGDYVERGVRAMEAAKLLASRASSGSLHVLGSGMAFAYLAVRGVLKGREPADWAKSLRAAFEPDSDACDIAMGASFGTADLPNAERICSHPERSWQELRSVFAKTLRRPPGLFLAEARRCIGRLLRPTGTSLKVRGLTTPQLEAAIPALKKALCSCFRDIRIGSGGGMRGRIHAARSVLTLEPSENDCTALDLLQRRNLSQEDVVDALRRHALDLLAARESRRYQGR